MKQKLCILLFFVAGISMANGHDFKRFGKENPPEINVDVVANVILKVVGNASSGIYKLVKKSGGETLMRLIKTTDVLGYKLAIATNGINHTIGKLDEEGVIKITDELEDGEVLETLEDVSYLDNGVEKTGDLTIVRNGDKVGFDVVDGLTELIAQVKAKFPEEWMDVWDDFVADFGDNTELLKLFNDNPDLVEAWKKMDDLGADDVLRRNPGALKALAKKMAGEEVPLPSTYLSNAYIANHLSKFEEGVTKIISYNPGSGAVGPPGGTFVLPKSQVDDLIRQADGDVNKLEDLLGLDRGDLGSNPYRIDVDNPSNLRMPSGNERGANSKWIPGGKTSGGTLEATIDQIKPGTYISNTIF